jgi:uncharacterized protein YmfQ (DUF2313 family)
MTDKHVRRSGDDYIDALAALLPVGPAWPREVDSTLMALLGGLAQEWGIVDGRAADLLERESDPRATIELLPDWERAWGLPDPCFPSATTIAERQQMLVLKMTWLGGQSRQYFINVMEWLGYTVTIKEFAPFMAGVSQVGDTRAPPPDSPIEDQNFRWYIGPAEQRFVWTINYGQIGLAWFRAASGQAGVDHHLEFRVPSELQCLLDRWKPAHTVLVPDFSQITNGGPMQGTP